MATLVLIQGNDGGLRKFLSALMERCHDCGAGGSLQDVMVWDGLRLGAPASRSEVIGTKVRMCDACIEKRAQ